VSDMKDIVYYFPWPPTMNSYYSHTRNGVFISKKGRLYRESISESAHEQSPGGPPRLGVPLAMTVYLFPPDKRKRDLDNHMKALQDAMTQCGIWEDDSLVDQLYIFRGSVVPKGSVIVYLREGGPVIPIEYVEQLIEDGAL